MYVRTGWAAAAITQNPPPSARSKGERRSPVTRGAEDSGGGVEEGEEC